MMDIEVLKKIQYFELKKYGDGSCMFTTYSVFPARKFIQAFATINEAAAYARQFATDMGGEWNHVEEIVQLLEKEPSCASEFISDPELYKTFMAENGEPFDIMKNLI